MYIPQTNHPNPDSSLAPATRLGVGLPSAQEFATHHNSPFPVESVSNTAHQLFTRSLGALSTTLEHLTRLRKRAGSNSVNTTIGVVVGILLAVFLLGFFGFFYFYGRSLRAKQRKHRRRKSAASKNSKNSESAGAAAPPAA
ncbi:uncharacterized protein GGS22DRAFT_79998 [Annulohypoxylon maeteangense]|uniref:uncharacterized protein n=1 Tax=Annulohypoxylon maeteangense TaxID=1927788 RepID=UPI002007FEBD|nr:uncharacterized protein GGS22DRAFT_79998 [Annulohypoxylon maeteangense]KAI0880772.1 hypothetical protein GGS22DRAFT_79998 [Annulohypoxylon maeteangense]